MSDICATFDEYVGPWVLPRAHGSASNLAELFLKSRETANTKAKACNCQASEALSLLPTMYIYVMKVLIPRGVARTACVAFVRLCVLIWCIVAAAPGRSSHVTLRDRTNEFYDACEAAAWQYVMTPKFHRLVNFPFHLRRFGCRLSCFVRDRKHRTPKRHCNDVRQLEASEKSVSAEVTCLHLHNLRDTGVFNFAPHLENPRAAPRRMHRFLEGKIGHQLPAGSTMTALAARASSPATCQSRDIVLFSEANGNKAVGEAWFHAAVHGTMVSLVSVWQVSQCDARSGALTVVAADDDVQLLHSTDIITAMVGALYLQLANHRIRRARPVRANVRVHACDRVDIRRGHSRFTSCASWRVGRIASPPKACRRSGGGSIAIVPPLFKW